MTDWLIDWLQSIDGGCFAALIKLENLNLANNAIFSLGVRDLVSVPSLRYLDLSGNSIAIAERGSLDGLKHLRGLFLADNRIPDPMNMFSAGGGKELLHLDLSNLPIPCIPPRLFLQYRSLKWLYFNGSLPLFVDMDADTTTLAQIAKTPMHPWAQLQFYEMDRATTDPHAFLRIEVPDSTNSIYQFILANFQTSYNPDFDRPMTEKIAHLICS